MIDLDKVVNKRYFQVKIGGVQLDVEPCTVKTLKLISEVTKTAEDDEQIDMLVNAVKALLGKNKQNYDTDDLVEQLNFDQLLYILTEYFNWLGKTKKAKN